MMPDACIPVPPKAGDDLAQAPTVVAQLLSQSRAAHLRKKHAAGKANRDGIVTSRPNYPAAEQAIREAFALRAQAHRLDPNQTDPAWAFDQVANRGHSSQIMMSWFQTYLTLP